MEPEEQPIEILVREEGDYRRGGVDTTTVTKTASELNQRFREFLRSLQAMVDVKDAEIGPFQLAEIQFSAEITVDGGFKLLGTGVSASASSGVTFILQRTPTGAKRKAGPVT